MDQVSSSVDQVANGVETGAPLAVPADAERRGTHLTDRWVTFTPHWLTVTIRRPLEVVQALVSDHFLGAAVGDDASSYFDQAGRSQWYDQVHRAKLGISIASGFVHKLHDHCTVNVPGSALEQLPRGGVDAVAAFLGHLLEMESGRADQDDDQADQADQDDDQADQANTSVGPVFKVTRLDLAFDGVPFGVSECVAAGLPGVRNVRSPVRRGHAIQPLGEPVAGEDGATFHWGSRSSDRLVRVYDRRGPVRLELESRRDKADLLARDLLTRPVDQWASRTVQHLRDFIDFVDRSSSSNISRAVLLPWWAAFVQGAERVRLRVERAASSLAARVVNQVKRNRRTISKAVQAFGLSWLQHHAIAMGNVVMTPRDRREVDELRDLAKRDPDAVGLYPSLVAAVESVAQHFVPSPTWRQYQLTM